MDSLSSTSPSIVLPLQRHHNHHLWRLTGVSFTCSKPIHRLRISEQFRRRNPFTSVRCKLSGEDEQQGGNDRRDEELERALRMDGTIPGTSDAFVRQVSSRAYDMRRHLQQSFDSSSYDVLEANPWRESSKSVFVLTHQKNHLCTMKTRRNRSEVERELGLLFSKGGTMRNQSKQSRTGNKFQMLVEDVREGVLRLKLKFPGAISHYQFLVSTGMATHSALRNMVFEDQNEAARYCDLLQGGGGQGCEGVAEIEASSVFDLCQKNRALAVLFRRGRTPPLPESLKLDLGARKRSLEDQEDLF